MTKMTILPPCHWRSLNMARQLGGKEQLRIELLPHPWDPCMVYLNTFTINVGQYTLHGSSGTWQPFPLQVRFANPRENRKNLVRCDEVVQPLSLWHVFFRFFRWFRGAKSAECGIREKNNSMLCYVYIFDNYNMIQWIYVRTVICKFLCLASWRSVQSQGFKEEWCSSLKWRQLKKQLKTRNQIPATTELGEAYRKMMHNVLCILM